MSRNDVKCQTHHQRSSASNSRTWLQRRHLQRQPMH